MKRISSIMFGLFCGCLIANADYVPKYELIDPEGVWYNEDLGVATFNVLDYGVDNTGQIDCTDQVQALLDAAGGVGVGSKNRGDYSNPSGGVVYFPSGTYLFVSGKLVVPRGVTIRGDWQRPDAQNGVKGTVFAIKPTKAGGKGVTSVSKSFITLQPSTLITNITFWYPEQNGSSVTKFPPTILYGQSGYWGNDYCNVRHCTFVNSYIGINFNSSNGGGCPNIWDIYGTPLYQGFVMDCIADVGRFDHISFSPDYWANSGLPGSPSRGEIASWLHENATAVVMRRNDWSYTCNLDVDSYAVGFHADESVVEGRPNGHNYGFDLKNCKVGIEISSTSGSGIMMTDVNTPGCDTGVLLHGGPEGPVQFYGCNIDGKSAAIEMEENASSAIMLQDCKVTGVTKVVGGHFQSVNSKYGSDVYINPKARTLFSDNSFSGSAKLKNNSVFECVVENPGNTYPALPKYDAEWMAIRETKPAQTKLFVATEFGATPLLITDINNRPEEWQSTLDTAPDNTAAIQAALNAAAAAGGGVVYLPKGHYRCTGNLVIPQGVELKGSSDIQTVPKGQGSILEVYTGEGDENGTPFINLERKSGLRGVTINYPRQTDPLNVKKYPYTVRGNADAYIVNLCLRAACKGVDLFTNKCDNHYVDYLAGHAFENIIRAGGGSENGVINNIQCNTIVYACGDETKFGSWLNSLQNKDYKMQQIAYCQNERDLDFLIVGDTKNQILYNNFLFGCNIGMHFVDDGQGGAANCRSLGNAVDGAVNTFVIEQTATNLDLINSQIVALSHNPSQSGDNGEAKHRGEVMPYMEAYFIKTGKNFDKTVNFFSSNNWGGGEYMIDAEGGKVVVAMSNMAACGSSYTAHAADGASIDVFNTRFNNLKKYVGKNGDEPRLSVTSSVIDESKVSTRGNFKEWAQNISTTWNFEATDVLLGRSGWQASASVNNGNARQAIDGVASTRWDTSKAQTQSRNEWFKVDFGKSLTFNAVVLDSSNSSSDGPGAYSVEVYTDGDWMKVAEGTGGASVTVVTFDEVTASAVRVTMGNSTKTNYWSIHEFYVGNFESSAVKEVMVAEDAKVALQGDYLIFAPEMEGCAVEIYDLAGRKLVSASNCDGRMCLDSLRKGVYVVRAVKADYATTLKFSR